MNKLNETRQLNYWVTTKPKLLPLVIIRHYISGCWNFDWSFFIPCFYL